MTDAMTLSPPRSVLWDGFGIAASGLCIAHCVLTPILVTAMPFAGTALFESELVHKALIALVMLLGLVAFFPALGRHRAAKSLSPLVMLGIGALIFAATGAGAPWGETGETGFTLLGGAAMIRAHWKNRTLCRTCDRCDSDAIDG